MLWNLLKLIISKNKLEKCQVRADQTHLERPNTSADGERMEWWLLKVIYV